MRADGRRVVVANFFAREDHSKRYEFAFFIDPCIRFAAMIEKSRQTIEQYEIILSDLKWIVETHFSFPYKSLNLVPHTLCATHLGNDGTSRYFLRSEHSPAHARLSYRKSHEKNLV
jgi:hypothetical protein